MLACGLQVMRGEQVKGGFAFDAVPAQRPFERLFVIRREWPAHQLLCFRAGFRQAAGARRKSLLKSLAGCGTV